MYSLSKETEQAYSMLVEGGLSIVLALPQKQKAGTEVKICRGFEIKNNTDTEYITSGMRGVAPLLELLDAGFRDKLKGALAADKVVGKASAMLMAYAGVKELHAVLLSKAGEECLIKCGIAYKYDKITGYIINRAGDGICPMEKCVADIDDAEKAYAAIKAKADEMKKK